VTSILGPAQIVQSQIHTLPQSIMDNKDEFYGRWISAEITWNCAGNSVAVLGSWDNWQTMYHSFSFSKLELDSFLFFDSIVWYAELSSVSISEPLQRSRENFTVTKVLPVGIHYYRFIVDGALVCASDLQWVCDDYGNHYNILNLQVTYGFCFLLIIYKLLQYFLSSVILLVVALLLFIKNIACGSTLSLSSYITYMV
jgi:hypothetical protein